MHDHAQQKILQFNPIFRFYEIPGEQNFQQGVKFI